MEEGEFGYDDVMVVTLPDQSGGAMVYTINSFKSFVSDPFMFRKITPIHALRDCYMMG